MADSTPREALNRTYVEGSNLRAHRLDLFLPEKRKNVPLVVFIHGGAWITGDKDAYADYGRNLARSGIAAAILNYRLSLTPRILHPMHSTDVADALKWLSSHHTDYGYNPEKIILVGHSAGAFIAAFLSTSPELFEGTPAAHFPKGAIAMAGIYDVPDLANKWPSYVDWFITRAFGTSDKWAGASPTRRKIQIKFPWKILHSSQDELVDLEQSQKFEKYLKANSIPAEMIPLKGSHTDILKDLGKADHPVTAHLNSLLK